MHQRTWLTILTLPLVTTFTYPVVLQSVSDAPKIEFWNVIRDPIVEIADIQDVLALICSHYVDKPNMEQTINGGIQGILEHTHPLNSYLTVNDLRLADNEPASIGISLIKRLMCAEVIAVIPNSPAAKAGIQIGDKIRKLDNNPVKTMSNWTLERKLCGYPGSELVLLYYSNTNGELKKLTLRRELVKPPAITVRHFAQTTVITLTDFNNGRLNELKALLSNLNSDAPLILDLRQCFGGSLTEAAKIAGLFVATGPLVTIKEMGKPHLVVPIIGSNINKFTNVAILQSEYTMGVAEAFASALKKQLIPIFGKCSGGLGVERTRFLLKHGGAVEVVNKYWIGANGELLSFAGDKPDRSPFNYEAKTSDGYGVVPNYAIADNQSEETVLFKVMEMLEAKRRPSIVP